MLVKLFLVNQTVTPLMLRSVKTLASAAFLVPNSKCIKNEPRTIGAAI